MLNIEQRHVSTCPPVTSHEKRSKLTFNAYQLENVKRRANRISLNNISKAVTPETSGFEQRRSQDLVVFCGCGTKMQHQAARA